MRNKYVALFLAFFFGGFGIHKFYLREKVIGVLYLLFCPTFVPFILGVLDFLNLLITSEKEFDQRYNLKFAQAKNLPIGNLASINKSQNIKQLPNSNSENSLDANIAHLKKIKELYEQGIITPQEYEQKRRKFVDLI